MKEQKKRNKKRQKQKVIKAPPAWIMAIGTFFVLPWLILKYKMAIDRSGIRDLKGPCLVLAPHTSNNDHLILGTTLWRARPTFVLSEHFMKKPLTRFFLGLMNVITKKMFCADAHTIMSILRAKASGRVIVLFPEGRLPANGHSVPVTAGTADLVKKLGIPVYVLVANGAYLTFPKWAKYPRRGKIQVTSQKLFDGEELNGLPVEEVSRRIDAAILHNDELAMAGVTYRCRDMTAGLNGILRRCPKCLKNGTLTTKDGHIRCTCGLDATLDHQYVLHDAPFTRIYEWYDWQVSKIDPLTEAMECEVDVASVDEKDNLVKGAGSGRIRMDKDYISFAGEVFGEGIAFRVPTLQVGGLPVTVAEHFDLYHNNKLYTFFPKEDPCQVIDWVAYLERYHDLQKEEEVN